MKKQTINGFAGEIAARLVVDQMDDPIEEWTYESWYTATLFQPYNQLHSEPYGVYAFIECVDERYYTVTFISEVERSEVITMCDKLMSGSLTEWEIHEDINEYNRRFSDRVNPWIKI